MDPRISASVIITQEQIVQCLDSPRGSGCCHSVARYVLPKVSKCVKKTATEFCKGGTCEESIKSGVTATVAEIHDDIQHAVKTYKRAKREYVDVFHHDAHPPNTSEVRSHNG